MDRDQRRDIHQQAAGPANCRLERLLRCARVRLLSRVEQRFHRLQAATKPPNVVLAAQRQAGQLQPGRPALGPRGQRRDGRIRQQRTGPRSAGPRSAGRRRDLGQQRRRLPGDEPQFRRAQLGQLPAGPQPRQRQRRVAAADQRQGQPRRPVLNQEPAPGPPPAAVPAARAAPDPAAPQARSTWWPAAHRAPPPRPRPRPGSPIGNLHDRRLQRSRIAARTHPSQEPPAPNPRAPTRAAPTCQPRHGKDSTRMGHLRVTPIPSRVRSVQIHGPKPKDGTWA